MVKRQVLMLIFLVPTGVSLAGWIISAQAADPFEVVETVLMIPDVKKIQIRVGLNTRQQTNLSILCCEF